MTECSDIAKRLRILRIDKQTLDGKKLSQHVLGQALNMSREKIGKIESGNQPLSDPADIIAFADFYGVSCDYILRGVQSEHVVLVHDLGLSDNAIKQMMDFKDRYSKSYGFISDMFDMKHGSVDTILENIGRAIDILTDRHIKKAQMLEADDSDEPTVEIGNGITVEYADIAIALVRNACDDFIQNMLKYIGLEAEKHAAKKHT